MTLIEATAQLAHVGNGLWVGTIPAPVVKTDHHLNVSLRLKQRSSKRVRTGKSAKSGVNA